MATLAADKTRTYEVGAAGPEFNHIPVVASDTIFAGAAVGDSGGTGNAHPITGTEAFMGFAVETVDNSAGAAGDKTIKVRQRGAVEVPVAGVTGPTDVGTSVYASDDDTFTLTPTANASIGKVKRHISGTTALVEFEAASARSI